MSAANWPACLASILKTEGGWSDDPEDPGGATMHGVTLATFRHYFGADMTKDDLRNITPDQESHIYQHGFWNPVLGDLLPSGVDLCVFDVSVNSGPGRAAKILQEAVGVTADGMIGPATLKAASAIPARTLIVSYSTIREAFYKSLSTFDHFGAGWLNRVDDVEQQALTLAKQTVV